MDFSSYRDAKEIKNCLEKIKAIATKRWQVMEICGGQTHAIMKYGLDQLLPVELLHGPGCPVCVTSQEVLESAIALAQKENLIFCTFADMLRVPAGNSDLMAEKARGADVRTVYSPLEAVQIAKENPGQDVVFFAVGFETTAPANAMAIYQAKQDGLKNLSFLVSQVLVPPAIEALLSNPQHRIDGFLAAGHVCAITGYAAYEELARKYKIPIVVTGFEPLDIVQGVLLCAQQLESGIYEVNNQYARSVDREGNLQAQKMLAEVFSCKDKIWRGIGSISKSGLEINENYAGFDASKQYKLEPMVIGCETECISGEILQGLKKPSDCKNFGQSCNPDHPLGATMVSAEGACSAYYQYRGDM